MSFEREWMCRFCLSVSEQKGSENRPSRCQSCHVVRCLQCGSYIKDNNPKLCYGCGTFEPKVEGAFVGTDQTMAIYAEAEWCRRNAGRHSDGMYHLATGYVKDGSGRITSWICKEVSRPDSTVSVEEVRELTDAEKARLRE